MNSQPVILLLFSKKDQAQYLEKMLAETYSVRIGHHNEDVGGNDISLLIADREMLKGHGKTIRQVRRNRHPVVLPVLLGLKHSDLGTIPPGLHTQYDEIIGMPCQAPELLVRIENLLRIRKLSLDSDQKGRRLEQVQASQGLLQNSEHKFRTIFENNLAVMFLIEPDTRKIVDCNQAAEKFYGWNRNRLRKMRIDDINTLSGEEIAKEMHKARSGAQTFFRFRHRLARGRERDVEIFSSKVVIDGKDYLHSIVHDITEQVRSEKALRQSERILRLFVEHSPAAIAMFDQQMRYIVYSRRFLQDYELEEKEITGKSHYEVFPDIPQRWKEIHNRCMKGEVISADSDPFPRKSGKTDWIRWEIRPWFQDDNSIGGLILFSEVITARKLAEQALRDSEGYNRMLFDLSPSGLVLTTLDGKLVEVNAAFSSIIGRTVEETCQLTSWEITPKKYTGQEQEQLRLLEEQGWYGPYEKEYIHKDGHLVPVRLQGLIIERDGEKYIWSSVEDITSSRVAQEALLESEKKYRYLFENNPLPMWVYDLETLQFMEVNKAAVGHYGYSMAEFESMTLKDIRPEEDIGLLLKDVAAIHSDYNTGGVWRHKKKNGAVIFAEIISHSIQYSNRKARLVLANDITDKRLAEEALRESEIRYKSLLEAAPVGIAVHCEGKLVFTNRSGAEILGAGSEEEVLGMDIADIILPRNMKSSRERINKMFAGEEGLYPVDEVFRKLDGTEVEVEVMATPIAYQMKPAVQVIVLDISDRRKKEEQIRKLNEQLEMLIESIQQLAVNQSQEHVQKTIASAARRLIGADGATLVNRDHGFCYYADEDAIAPLWKGKRFPMESCISGWVMKNKTAVVIEDIYKDDRISKDMYSPTFVRSLAMVPVRINEPVGAIGTYWKKKYRPTASELALLQTLADAAARAIENIQLYQELEERVKQRTAQLQSVNKELETFTYSVSHDLKAPLRGIDGYSKILLDEYAGKLDEEANRFIRTIRSSALHMNHLIDDLLNYSRLDRSAIRQESIPLKSFVAAVVSNYNEAVENKEVSFAIDVPEIEIIADTTGLSIALRNCVENALKFSSSVPHPEIGISVEESPGWWVITVRDNGVGFDMKYHDRIFEIFQRLHRQEDFPGTGIGLAMVAKALQRMGGKVHGESTPGNGATFYLELPKTITDDNAQKQSPYPAG